MPASLFAEYCREKGMIVVENEKGFMSAYVHNSVCMVDNFYVIPQARGKSAAFRLTMALIELAKERGCHTFCAEIYKIDPLYHYILRLHKHFGMSPVEETPFKTVTAKRIETHAEQSRIAAAH